MSSRPAYGKTRVPSFYPALPAQGAETGAKPKKRPWVAAGETIITNLGVWAVDRYVSHADWAYISWDTIKNNLKHGFEYDNDPFFTNFFLHPYHGTLYFNTARSLGMNFWGSTLYAFGGSMMWELFMENARPSIDDLILTTTAGAYGGEVLFRMSSLVLDDTASGEARFWREVLALILNPWRGVNRLIYGDAWRTDSVNRQIRKPIGGSFAVTSNYFATNARLSGTKQSTGLELDFTYGETYSDKSSRQPFDLIVVESGLRFGKKQPFFNIDTYALLYGWDNEKQAGQKYLFGFFQNYDYLKNEEIEMGGSSLTAGVISDSPLGPKLNLRTSLQVGAMIFGASDNPYTFIASRDYNYGLGPILKADIRLSHRALGTLAFAFKHYEIYTFEGAAHDTDESHDHLSIVKAQYGVPIWKGLGLRAEYDLYFRHTHFEGHPSINPSLSRLGISAFVGF